MIVVYILMAMLGMSIVSVLIDRYAVNFEPYAVCPVRHAIQWGHVGKDWYIRINLPSWGYDYVLEADRFMFCRRVLMWRSYVGWFLVSRPVENPAA